LKIAIFGGTFDPIHCAHLTVAREAAHQFAVDQVLFVPAANPPHKLESAPYEDRFRMVELACEGEPRFVPSRLEEGRGKSYSLYTIERVRDTLAPGDELYFIIGADAFADITSWFRWRKVVALVEFIVVTRPGAHYDAAPEARVQRLETLALPVSSSEIRARLARGEKPEELPDGVLAYIEQRGLYRADA
jgi:nicotinate-nucleotide adenylyltransferase